MTRVFITLTAMYAIWADTISTRHRVDKLTHIFVRAVASLKRPGGRALSRLLLKSLQTQTSVDLQHRKRQIQIILTLLLDPWAQREDQKEGSWASSSSSSYKREFCRIVLGSNAIRTSLVSYCYDCSLIDMHAQFACSTELTMIAGAWDPWKPRELCTWCHWRTQVL